MIPPIAWYYEVSVAVYPWEESDEIEWRACVDFTPPIIGPGVRNIRPLVFGDE